jgi:tRNA-modifying protein YgfZ
MTTTSFCAPVARDLVVVHGPDATKFLQSLVSQDLDAMPVGATGHSLLLQPQGKLIVDFWLGHLDAEGWWCVTEGGFGSTLAEGLRRFKIRVKVEIESRTVAALAVRGQEPPADTGGVETFAVAWGGVPAFDAIGTEEAVDALRDRLGLPVLDGAGYERARIEAGVPRMGADLDERTIPQEAGLEGDAVSFTKGCFVGQELVCRIDTRGHVNRLLRRLRANEPLEAGAEVARGDKVVGVVTSAVGEVALAMLRREIEPGAEVRAGVVTAVVEPGAIDAP